MTGSISQSASSDASEQSVMPLQNFKNEIHPPEWQLKYKGCQVQLGWTQSMKQL